MSYSKIRKCELLISPILLVLTSLNTLVVFLKNVQTSHLEIIVIFIYQVLLKENKILFVCARQRSQMRFKTAAMQKHNGPTPFIIFYI